MKFFYGLEQVDLERSSVVTVGTFDGMHVGHQAILRYVIDRARSRQGPSVVVSFDPHPREVVHGEAVPLLTTVDERRELLEAVGIDRFVVIPFTRTFSQLGAEAFVREVLVAAIGMQEVVIGYDHAFGRSREGDAQLLARLGAELGFEVDVIPAQVVERHVVSSTEIRRLLVDGGDVAGAAQMLGRPYQMDGRVVRGDGRGRTIGFPTANLELLHPRKVVPRHGVYAVRTTTEPETGDAFQAGGMMNIGVRPTFDGSELRIEVHLFDVEADLYGAKLRVEFVDRIRDERKFTGVDALVEQLSHDRSRCRQLLESVA